MNTNFQYVQPQAVICEIATYNNIKFLLPRGATFLSHQIKSSLLIHYRGNHFTKTIPKYVYVRVASRNRILGMVCPTGLCNFTLGIGNNIQNGGLLVRFLKKYLIFPPFCCLAPIYPRITCITVAWNLLKASFW